MTTFSAFQNMIGSVPNWCFLWCEVKGGLIKGWINPEDTKKPPQLSIDLAPKVRSNESLLWLFSGKN